MKLNNFSQRGFTFIEVLLVIGILGLIVGLAIPFYQSFQVSSELDNTSQTLIQTLRRAQARAMAAEADNPFGVHLESQKFVLFQGASYMPNDPKNETTEVARALSINPQLGANVVFSKITGETTNTGSITLSGNNKSKIITINSLGVINAQ